MGYSIAVFGAFNVHSFGDSLFPEAIYSELQKRIEIDEFCIFSLGGKKNPYSDKKVYDYSQFEEINETKKFDAIIIGGGELLHNLPINFPEENVVYEAGAIWKIPVNLGIKYKIPVIMNSVGMPYEFKENDRVELEKLFSAASYVSLRDEYSYQRWTEYFGEHEKAVKVPDSLWNIREYFEEEKLETSRNTLKEKYEIKKPYIVVQYGTTKYFREVMKILDRFAENNNIQVCAIAINAAHEDLYVVQNLGEYKNFVDIKEVLTPEEIVALISGAELFVGTSLHGNLTAMAYDVKNVIIDMYPGFVSKLDGLAEMQDITSNFVNEISDLWYVLNEEYSRERFYSSEKVKELVFETEKHYDRISDIIKNHILPKENMEHTTGKVVEQPLFQKVYFKYYSSNGLLEIKKYVAKYEYGHYALSTDRPKNEKCIKTEVAIPVEKVLRIKIEEGNKYLVNKNDIGNEIYIGPMVRWNLKAAEHYSLKFDIEDIDVNEISKELLTAYCNEAMHSEQLMLQEQDNSTEINILRGENNTLYCNGMQKSEEIENLREVNIKLSTELECQKEGVLKLQSERDSLYKKISLLRKEQAKAAEIEAREKKNTELIKEYEGEIARLRQEVLNKEGHIELLLPAERERDAIVQSKMYKIMRFICRTYDCIMIFPRFIGRNIYAFCRMMTHVNVQELKIAYGYVKNEGIKGAYQHLMRDYHQGELKQIKVDVDEKIYDEITDIHECETLKLPQFEKPTVSIVIPAYNQFTYTYYCIKSILENSGDVSYEVILADDCSNDFTTEIASVVENLIIARTPSNMLFLRNCNNAAKQAKGKYVLFLNNDTQVQENWLKPLVDLCEKDQTIGMTGSKLVYADGTLQEAGGIIWRDGSGWNYGRNDDAMKPEYNYVRDVDYISGASIMIRRTLWEELGGFDEYFAPAYCEDSDLAFRVRKAGYRVVYQPLSVVVHFEGKSNGTDLKSGVKQYQVENSIKLKKRWKDELAKQYECGQFVFKARERSQDKKTILVIDHYVPQFDKDAGSKTTIQYLRMFVEKGYMVKFIGDNFYQHEPYTTVLQQMGIEVLYGPWYAQHWQEWLLQNKNCIDFAYLNRPHITIKYIDFIRENTDIKCIYYGHDLHFLRLQREYELTGDIEKKCEADEWLEKELYIMRKADISYYPSYVEEEAIHKIDASIPVKAITAYVYEQFRNNIPMDFAKREGIVFVGGFGHPPNADAVLWFAKEIYPLICQKVQMPFYIVGSSVTPEIEKLEGNGIIVKGFVSEEELARLYDTCRLVVVPLRYGAGVKGKVVEALYYGTPMVTTSVGIEGIPDPEKFVRVEDEAESFANAVVELYQDEKLLAKTVENYQKLIKENFSLDAVWNIVKDDFK